MRTSILGIMWHLPACLFLFVDAAGKQSRLPLQTRLVTLHLPLSAAQDQ